jgi:hypothetical protein
MGNTATHEDANLILKLYESRREEKLREAREWFGANFHANTLEEMQALCPPGSKQNAYFRMVVSYWEMVASFLTSGALNRELYYQSGFEMLFVWERIRNLAQPTRAMMKNPYYWANFERAATEYIEWANQRAPEWHAAFQQMVKGVTASQTAKAKP